MDKENEKKMRLERAEKKKSELLNKLKEKRKIVAVGKSKG